MDDTTCAVGRSPPVKGGGEILYQRERRRRNLEALGKTKKVYVARGGHCEREKRNKI